MERTDKIITVDTMDQYERPTAGRQRMRAEKNMAISDCIR